jgi:hypothetical protein
MMSKKKEYIGGVKLTAKTARAVAMQEFGTARGLTKEEYGNFKMQIGNLFIDIRGDGYWETGCIVVSVEMAYGSGRGIKFLDPATLKDNFDALERSRRMEDRETMKDWVNSNGPEFCHKQIDTIWERG